MALVPATTPSSDTSAAATIAVAVEGKPNDDADEERAGNKILSFGSNSVTRAMRRIRGGLVV